MKQEVNNFARFYAAFNRMPCSGDREGMKRDLVRQWTWNRTDSLREMTRTEYDACCDAMERITGIRDDQKKKRSACLKLMQQMGIDTTDWNRINAFCQDQRIAGKPFARLKNEELDALAVKLRSIQRKGGLKQKAETHQAEEACYVLPMNGNTAVC